VATRLQEVVEWWAVCGWHSKVEVERKQVGPDHYFHVVPTGQPASGVGM